MNLIKLLLLISSAIFIIIGVKAIITRKAKGGYPYPYTERVKKYFKISIYTGKTAIIVGIIRIVLGLIIGITCLFFSFCDNIL